MNNFKKKDETFYGKNDKKKKKNFFFILLKIKSSKTCEIVTDFPTGKKLTKKSLINI